MKLLHSAPICAAALMALSVPALAICVPNPVAKACPYARTYVAHQGMDHWGERIACASVEAMRMDYFHGRCMYLAGAEASGPVPEGAADNRHVTVKADTGLTCRVYLKADKDADFFPAVCAPRH